MYVNWLLYNLACVCGAVFIFFVVVVLLWCSVYFLLLFCCGAVFIFFVVLFFLFRTCMKIYIYVDTAFLMSK